MAPLKDIEVRECKRLALIACGVFSGLIVGNRLLLDLLAWPNFSHYATHSRALELLQSIFSSKAIRSLGRTYM